MNEIWSRIEAWLAANVPDGANALNPGASPEEIAATEAHLGVLFPDAVHQSYLRHNGERDGIGLLEGWEWLSLEGIRTQWDCWKGLLDGGDFDGIHSEPGGRDVKNDWWNPKWIPLSYNGCGDHHCVDLDPGRRGRVGQIIQMWHDASERPVLAQSFEEWLREIADELEAGKYVHSEDYFGLVRKEDV